MVNSFSGSEPTLISVQQDGARQSALFVDTNELEVLERAMENKIGPVDVCFAFDQIEVVVAARILSIKPTELGSRISIAALDDRPWNYCIEAAKATSFDIGRLIKSTRPGVGAAPVVGRKLASSIFHRHWPKASALVLALLVSTLTYNKFFFRSSTEANVAVEEVVVTASGAGRVIFATNRAHVLSGEPVAGIARGRSRDRALESPCDCDVARRLVAVGSAVVKAEPLLSLSRPGAPRFVKALFSAADMPSMLRSRELVFHFDDGTVSRSPVPINELLKNAKSVKLGLVEVSLNPVGDLPSSMIGQPLRVSYSAVPELVGHVLTGLGMSQ